MARSMIFSVSVLLYLANLSLASEPEFAIFPREIQLTAFQPEQQISVRRILAGGSFSEDLLRSEPGLKELQIRFENPDLAQWIRDENGTHRVRANRPGQT
ncbi:MAG: hypothetical protein ACK553_03965, partial [Planctomycetota bacterium]